MTGKQSSHSNPESRCLSRLAGRQSIVRVLAAAGAGPASKATGMVRGGRVAINGRVVRDPAVRADPFRDRILLDDQPLSLNSACRYLLFYKPYGVLCAFTDPDHDRRGGEKRPTLADYIDVPDVYPTGRLDFDSEGLVLLTGDGWLIHRMGHPRYQHPKTYLVQVEGVPGPDALTRLRKGLLIKDRKMAAAAVELLVDPPDLPPRSQPIRYRKSVPTAWLRLVLTEGKKRQVRHMTAAVGYPTLRLLRVGIGPLRIDDLEPGQWRDLATQDMDALRELLYT